MLMRLDGKVALVTGAARRLGRAVALALAGEGCRMAIHFGSSRQAAEEMASELRDQGSEARALQADLSDPRRIEGLFAEVSEHFQRLDILVNSAASFESRPFHQIDAEDWDSVMALNLRAPFLCSRHAAALMGRAERAETEAGLIVNMGDLSGVQAWRGFAHHGVSKAGLLHLTRIAARELAPGVRVNAVVPGPILPPPGMDEESEEWARVGERIPLGRAGRSSEVGDAVLFLARNDYVTGEVLHVGGGEHLMGVAHR